ncbi:Cytochrome P450 [Geosmithia morbida]|uniref:Cytochrome P450 n=1 Tax=Geosmithia morbida TaxID=1094350 RepID=A0A9P4YYN6_9HYPO|nr:Cytochrome P450 [Geosmithia morbida]KAF4125513.1 Cytochrome P450 [Geosmithia morbida]
MCSAVLLLVLLLLLVTFAYNITFHPLADVPGPRLAAISSTWLASHAKNGRLGELGRTLHSQYGPAVRVAPDQVWFNSRAAFKAIYRPGSGFEKSDYYRQYHPLGLQIYSNNDDVGN